MSYADTAETALVLLMDGLPDAVENLRSRFDRTVAMNVPTHMTVVIPFVSASKLGPDIEKRLAKVARHTAPQRVLLAQIGQFPGSLHLAPADPGSLADLLCQICEAFPETPPYEGRFDEVHPHVTVAYGDAGSLGDAHEMAKALVPVPCRVARLAVLRRVGQSWRMPFVLPLRGFPRETT